MWRVKNQTNSAVGKAPVAVLTQCMQTSAINESYQIFNTNLLCHNPDFKYYRDFLCYSTRVLFTSSTKTWRWKLYMFDIANPKRAVMSYINESRTLTNLRSSTSWISRDSLLVKINQKRRIGSLYKETIPSLQHNFWKQQCKYESIYIFFVVDNHPTNGSMQSYTFLWHRMFKWALRAYSLLRMIAKSSRSGNRCSQHKR